jgi:hypothetical protein
MQRVDQSGIRAEDVEKCLAARQQLAHVGEPEMTISHKVHLSGVKPYLLASSHPSLASFHAVPNVP